MMKSSEFYAALLGGGISALTAVGFFWWEKSWAETLRKKELSRTLSAQVFSVITKLKVFLEGQISLDHHITACFEQASDCFELVDGKIYTHANIADIVGEVVLPPIGIDFTSEELSLCILSGDQGLFEKLLSAQSDYFSTYRAMIKLNGLLEDYRLFKADVGLSSSLIEGDRGVIDMPTEARFKQEAKAMPINRLVGELVGFLESDIPHCRKTILRFVTAMRSIRDVEVPKVRLILHDS